MYFNTDAARAEGAGHRQAAQAGRGARRTMRSTRDLGHADPADAARADGRAGPSRARMASSSGSGTTCWATSRSRTERWRRFNDYYINCMRSVDMQIASAARASSMRSAWPIARSSSSPPTTARWAARTACTARGRSPTRRASTCRCMIVAPGRARAGRICRALTGHIDLVPTLLAMAGVMPASGSGEIAGRDLPGQGPDAGARRRRARPVCMPCARACCSPTAASSTNDAELVAVAGEAKAAGKNPQETMKAQGFQPDLRKRGSLRTRVRRPLQVHPLLLAARAQPPGDLDELYRANDVELFDLADRSGRRRATWRPTARRTRRWSRR